MFRNLIKLGGCLGLLSSSNILCNQIKGKNSEDQLPHFHFINDHDLQKLQKKHTNLQIIDRSYTEHILSVIRDVETDIVDFRKNADRLIRILIEQAISQIEKKKHVKQSPLGYYDAHELKFSDEEICFVSILRSGNAFLIEALKIMTGASIGQILIQRNEETSQPSYFFQKLPKNIKDQQVILVDPMLATGGSASMALKILKNHGVKEENITFLTLVSCEQGLSKLFSEHPKIKIITAQVDPILLQDINYLAPGIGDFGDRYFGTVKSSQGQQ
ncbi:unnamed protein product (macronuclear) [Paramecium tetraurelia]|uniref:uracil phosphoribosyltransferase n=1 Tax=Paramecium tetraurelia TaxID=5888 RepID=A0EFQ8_PARTE|nr:uncharacterized protein GSPATT00026472001 [Paramecium tetraurelia]CAK94149.1 unnamed protein product [Paramecium tetraurelia]|eukprot:XP_001461522.1 hypothetical protein (macronuclear) [Paramecium tetraurelia strain d4-2]